MDCIFEKVLVQLEPNPFVEAVREIRIPEDLNAAYERPDRQEVIDAYVSRFNRGRVL